MPIPLSKPTIGPDEATAISRVLESGVLTVGAETAAFEEEFARFVGRKYAIAVSNGTAALHLSLICGLRSEITKAILSPLGFISDINVLLYGKITPHYVDINPATLSMDINRLADTLDNKDFKAVLVGHMYGYCAYNKDSMALLSARKDVDIIGDACQTLLPHEDDPSQLIGSIERATAYSFAGNKVITSGQGGMVVTDDEDVYTKARSLRDQGRLDRPDWVHHMQLGYNYKMTEIKAAMGRVQLSKARDFLKRRTAIAQHYKSVLTGVNNISVPTDEGVRSYFNYHVLFPNKGIRDAARNTLVDNQIGCRLPLPPLYTFSHAAPLHTQNEPFTHTEHFCDTALEIPMYPGLAAAEIDQVCDVLKEAVH